jgi:hypothetical protein
MAHDDRDRTFEKALARHLRSSASSGGDAHTLGGVSSESCPDPEILAAYHDASLSLEERNFWKQHVIGCERCQLVLAHLETTLEVPLNLASHELARTETTPAVNAAAAAAKVRALDSAQPAKANRPPTMRWLWLVPAGAIAAGLVAYVSLHETKPFPKGSTPSAEVAENRPVPPVATAQPGAGAVTGERKEKDQRADHSAGTITGSGSAGRESAADELRTQPRLAQQTPNQSAANAAHGPSVSLQKQQQQQLASRIAAGAAGDFDQKKLEAPAAPKPSVVGGQMAASVPPPPPPPPSSEPGFLAEGTVPAPLAKKTPAPPPASNVAAPKEKFANADAISTATESVEVSAEPQTPARAKAMLRDAALQNPHVFFAPGGKQLWRLGPAGSLEHSSDSGLKWVLQDSGVTSDLVAGSAPSAKVCWVVGASGTILRTTDGGKHWIKLESPVTHDLTAIRAADALHAWISFVPEQQPGVIKTFQTSDGGATWSPAPAQ